MCMCSSLWSLASWLPVTGGDTYGARTEAEARSFFTAATRRRVGVFVLREFVRHRLRRIPYVGVPYSQMQAVGGQPAGAGGFVHASDFHSYQTHIAHATAAAAGG